MYIFIIKNSSVKQSLCEIVSHYLVVSYSSSFFISAKRAASFEQESLISGTMEIMTSMKICIISITRFPPQILTCFINEKHNHYPWSDVRKLRHSTEEMKMVVEEKKIINSLLPGLRWQEMIDLGCVCVSEQCGPVGEDLQSKSAGAETSFCPIC